MRVVTLAVAAGLGLTAAPLPGGSLSLTGASRAGAPSETVELVASERGFTPRVVNIRRGEPVRLRLTTSDREHCLAIDALRIEKRILPDKPTVLDLTAERAGTFPFHCCIESGAAAEKEHGRLVVIE